MQPLEYFWPPRTLATPLRLATPITYSAAALGSGVTHGPGVCRLRWEEVWGTLSSSRLGIPTAYLLRQEPSRGKAFCDEEVIEFFTGGGGGGEKIAHAGARERERGRERECVCVCVCVAPL